MADAEKLSSRNAENGLQLFERLISSQLASQQKNKSNNVMQSNRNSSNTSSSCIDDSSKSIESLLMLDKRLDMDSRLIPNGGIMRKEIVEIYGPQSSGKTELIMHLMARHLLPCEWRFTIDNDETENQKATLIDLTQVSAHRTNRDANCDAVLVDTDLNFSVIRLFTIMEQRVLKCIRRQIASARFARELPKLKLQVKSFVNKCLYRLTVFRCLTSEQYIFALVALDHHIQAKLARSTASKSLQPASMNFILPIFIDSINSNYEWTDRLANKLDARSVEHDTESLILVHLKQLVERYNCIIIATRCNLNTFSLVDRSSAFLSYSSNQFDTFKKWQTIVSKRIELTNQIIAAVQHENCNHNKSEEEKKKDSVDENNGNANGNGDNDDVEEASEEKNELDRVIERLEAESKTVQTFTLTLTQLNKPAESSEASTSLKQFRIESSGFTLV